MTAINDYHWVDSDQRLAELCQQWQQQAAIAVDTEFMRSSTFFPKVGLLQIGDGKANYLIDPLAISALEPLRQLWQNPAVTKVLHACSEDLEVFQHWLGVLPTPMFDTQVGAAYAGLGFSLSYAKLVLQLMDIELEKGETRSDWLARPLSQAQLHYAALDVDFLLVVYGKIRQQLEAKQRWDWALADCQMAIEQAAKTEALDSAYLKIKSAWRLNPKALAVLQALAQWREQQARARDIPRNRLLKDPQLIALAKYQPNNFAALGAQEGIHGRTLRDDGETLLDIIDRAIAEPGRWPERMPAPLSVEQGQRLKTLRDYVQSLGEGLKVTSELLFNKKEYEQILRHLEYGEPLQSPRFNGWREQALLQPLLAAQAAVTDAQQD
ncbi:MAG: ribonuclease D [Cellvibrionaceae bacterium]|nr:ribonuclease D [Cellvibrionaceae bacterium]